MSLRERIPCRKGCYRRSSLSWAAGKLPTSGEAPLGWPHSDRLFRMWALKSVLSLALIRVRSEQLQIALWR
jgi:hypothetical protein